MIENAAQLNATLHQLSSFVDSLDALQLDCARKDDFRLFPVLSEGYLSRIRELNAEIREYVKVQPEPVATGR
jgi:hypothetical protein